MGKTCFSTLARLHCTLTFVSYQNPGTSYNRQIQGLVFSWQTHKLWITRKGRDGFFIKTVREGIERSLELKTRLTRKQISVDLMALKWKEILITISGETASNNITAVQESEMLPEPIRWSTASQKPDQSMRN